MKLTDAAHHVLSSKADEILDCREIVELAIRQGLIVPKSARPWSHMQSALNLELKNDLAKGKKSRFERINGKWKVAK